MPLIKNYLMNIFKHIYVQVLIAIFLAVIFGIFFPDFAQRMKPLGDCFIKLIKMCVAPIIFTTIVSGILSSADLKKVGKIGIKTLIYFEILTTIALLIGIAVMLYFKVGQGLDVDINSIDSSAIKNYEKPVINFIDFILNIIPTTIFSAFVEGEILSILFVALIFGIALSMVKDKAPLTIKAIDEISTILFKIIKFIMHLAPIGAFGAMSYVIGKYGFATLLPLAKLMICFYITCILFIIIILGLVMKLCGSSVFTLIRFIKEEIFLVFGTSSSESALPSMMKKMQDFGCPKSVVGIVIPSGYSFNLDGTCIYFTMAIIFIAQAFNIDLSFAQIFGIISILLVASKGAAAFTGGGFITLAATLSVVPEIPVEGLVIILGIDRFMSEGRALTNLIGNGVATVAISKWEGEFKSNK